MLVFLRAFFILLFVYHFFLRHRGITSRGYGGKILRAPNQCGRRRKVPKMSHVLSSIQ